MPCRRHDAADAADADSQPPRRRGQFARFTIDVLPRFSSLAMPIRFRHSSFRRLLFRHLSRLISPPDAARGARVTHAFTARGAQRYKQQRVRTRYETRGRRVQQTAAKVSRNGKCTRHDVLAMSPRGEQAWCGKEARIRGVRRSARSEYASRQRCRHEAPPCLPSIRRHFTTPPR